MWLRGRFPCTLFQIQGFKSQSKPTKGYLIRGQSPTLQLTSKGLPTTEGTSATAMRCSRQLVVFAKDLLGDCYHSKAERKSGGTPTFSGMFSLFPAAGQSVLQFSGPIGALRPSILSRPGRQLSSCNCQQEPSHFTRVELCPSKGNGLILGPGQNCRGCGKYWATNCPQSTPRQHYHSKLWAGPLAGPTTRSFTFDFPFHQDKQGTHGYPLSPTHLVTTFD